MTPAELSVVVVAMLFGAVVKGAIGTGLPLVAIPVMAGFIGVEEAVVVMTLPTVVTNSWLLLEHREFVGETRDLPALLCFGVVGVAVGAWALTAVDAPLLMLAVAAMVGIYIVLFLTKPSLELPGRLSRRLSPAAGGLAGALQGATGISGPVLTIYTHALRLPRRAFLFQLAAQIQVFALVQVGMFAMLGLYDRGRLLGSVLALVPAAIGLPLGIRLSSRLPRRGFELLVLGFLVVVAIKLVVDAVLEL